MKKVVIIILILLGANCHLMAQDTLPKINVVNISNNILISWTNPFTSLTTISIQRSYDSTKNFTTIGSVFDVKNKKNGYLDQKPLSTQMFYRLFLSFEGGVYMFTDSYRPITDTTSIIPAIVVKPEINTGFVPSKFIYTGKYNNLIINLPDAENKNYNIKFFEEDGTFLFHVRKIGEPYLILEKVHFMHSGQFNYELYDGDILVEKYRFYIAKDGKPILNSSPEIRRN